MAESMGEAVLRRRAGPVALLLPVALLAGLASSCAAESPEQAESEVVPDAAPPASAAIPGAEGECPDDPVWIRPVRPVGDGADPLAGERGFTEPEFAVGGVSSRATIGRAEVDGRSAEVAVEEAGESGTFSLVLRTDTVTGEDAWFIAGGRGCAAWEAREFLVPRVDPCPLPTDPAQGPAEGLCPVRTVEP